MHNLSDKCMKKISRWMAERIDSQELKNRKPIKSEIKTEVKTEVKTESIKAEFGLQMTNTTQTLNAN